MADLGIVDRPLGKRERLIASAVELLHRQGVHPTTLAEIAEAADVPAGNVYYYFKTKDELLRAVIDAHAEHMRRLLDSFESRRTPQARLKAFVRWWLQVRETIAQYGCPLGSLSAELDKRGDGFETDVAKLFAIAIDWVEAQFHAMGRREARTLAISLMASIQGAALLATTFKDEEMLQTQLRRLERWIDDPA